MVKFLKQSKNVINYSKKAKNLDYISIKNYITRLDVRYTRWFLLRKSFENKLNECFGTPRVNKTAQHGINLTLEGFKDYFSNLAGNLLKKLTKPPNKFT